RYKVLGFAWALAVVTYIHRLGFSGAAPKIQQSLGLDDYKAGLLASAFLVAYGLFQVPIGLLGDRLGGRHMLPVLVFCWSVLTACVALAALLPIDTLWPFILLLVLR